MFFAITSYINGIASIIATIFVYSKKRDTHLSKLFCGLTLSIAWYSILLANVVVSPTEHQAILWAKIEHIGVALIPAISLHFCLAVIRIDKRTKLLLSLAYLFSIFLILTLPTGWFENGVREIAGLKYYIRPGPLYFLYFLFYVVCFAYAEVQLLRVFLRNRKSSFGRQALFVFLASFLGSGMGSVTFLPVFGFNVSPTLNCLVILYVLSLAYAILRYRLLDVQVIIRKTLVFAGLFAMVMAIVAAVTTITQRWISQYLMVSPMVSTALSVLIAVFLYEPTRKFLENVTNRYLFQKKYDIRSIIKEVATRSVRILDMQELSQEIVETLVSAMSLYSACVAILDEKEESFRIIYAQGVKRNVERVPENDLLVRYLERTREVLNLEDPEFSQKLPVPLLSRMETLNAVIAIPLLIQNQLVGWITLGRKKSDAEYTKEDFDYFALFQSQFAVALSNARLYYELKQSRLEFAQQAKMAAIGILSQGINHQVRNPLTIIKGKAQVLKMNLRDGIYNGKTREELIQMLNEITTVAIENSDRANDIMIRLAAFASPTKGELDEEVDLEKELRAIFPFVEKQLELNNIRYELDIPSDLPHVLGDGKQLAEVFLNLLNNAYQAILLKDRENRRVMGEVIGSLRMRAELKDGTVLMHFEDTGIGIPEDKLEEIYTPFYTTKEDARSKDQNVVTGTGLGLYVCRQIVEQHRGKIQVRSKAGEGTTFTLVFTRLVEAVSQR